MESVIRGLQTVARRSGSHGDSLKCVCGNTGVPQKRPTARDVEASPSLRRDLLSFGFAFGEPVTAPHVANTWPLGWTVGSVRGDALNVWGGIQTGLVGVARLQASPFGVALPLKIQN